MGAGVGLVARLLDEFLAWEFLEWSTEKPSVARVNLRVTTSFVLHFL